MINKWLRCQRRWICYIQKLWKKETFYAKFEIILVPEDNGEQNPNESYTNRYQKHVTCSHDHKLKCVNDKFSKPYKSNLGEDDV